ncbi:zinc finger family protein [Tripterygium wilfordii]|uniref:RING-type E3 ubiquitin transferase n=1 Tax=Tripterygium wilfordii TaxID=458696 RepID=A0A7J7DGM1_TRIWF|nr:E3 ubiquitin-protein ligase MPSR1-like [Tripterygium wilfordii]KAF5745453.1 zinc finger family protein [Tripterygium wilfordii]
MASETETSDFSAAFERLLRNRDMSLLLPLILGFASSTQEGAQAETRRIVLVNPVMQIMVVIEGDSLLDVMGSKNGQPPASKASIDAMPCVDVTKIEGEDGDCVICLENWGAGGVDVVIKEMPCKHRFHSNCIEKWLRVHGSCPVCRYQMPVEERNNDDEEEGRERRGVDEIWVTFALSRSSRSATDENQTTSTDSSDDSASPRPDHELDG